ncbi:MAG: hypothetical protein R3F21_08965 [Myxococcota bacterium]
MDERDAPGAQAGQQGPLAPLRIARSAAGPDGFVEAKAFEERRAQREVGAEGRASGRPSALRLAAEGLARQHEIKRRDPGRRLAAAVDRAAEARPRPALGGRGKRRRASLGDGDVVVREDEQPSARLLEARD